MIRRIQFVFRLGALLALASCSSSDGESGGAPSEGGGDSPQPPQKEYAEIRVVSFNIRVDNSADGTNAWSYRREGAVTMVGREQPAVLGLQEAQAHQITYLAQNCPDYAWYGLGRDTASVPPETSAYSREETMAIFWDTRAVELQDKGTFWLSETPGKVSSGWDANYNRTCTWGQFRHKKSGRVFFVFNTHLDDSGKVAREESVKLLVAKMKEINPRRRPSFLTGDFNSNTTDAIFSPLFAYMNDARAKAPVTDNHATWNGYTGTSTAKYDHIFYNGDNCTAREYRTLTGDYGVPYLSDHYPVSALFRLQD